MTVSIYRVGAGVFTALVVVLQYWLQVRGLTGAAFLRTTIRFFSFFTILTNVLAAIALIIPGLAPRSWLGNCLSRPTVQTAVAGYMIMVGLVYYVLLAGLSHREGWQLVLEHILHAVTPPLFAIGWLAFVDKRDLDVGIGVRALVYPLAYGGYTLIHGAGTGWYPYPFLDVDELGYARVLVNIAGLVAAFVALEALLAVVGRRLRIGAP
ncbi:MAG: Pr6Pr family membrane protein [Hyphomicrobium sp.]